jgi:hypothetical protein
MNADPNLLGHTAPPDPRLYVLYKDPFLMGHASGSNYLGLVVKT